MGGILRMNIKGRKLVSENTLVGIDVTVTMAPEFLLLNEGVNENHRPVMYLISLWTAGTSAEVTAAH